MGWQHNALSHFDQARVRRREDQRQMPGEVTLSVTGDEGDLAPRGHGGGEAGGVIDQGIEVVAAIDRLEGARNVCGIPQLEAGDSIAAFFERGSRA